MFDAGLIKDIATRAKSASRGLVALSTEKKSIVLKNMASSLRENASTLQSANEKDLAAAKANDLSDAMIDRLVLSDSVIESMAAALEEIAEMPDPIGGISGMTRRPSGLLVGRMRIPLGVVAMIYESRPNVTSDAAGLCIKSSNAVILRGGSEAIHSNTAIAGVLKDSLESSGINPDVLGFIPITDRQAVNEMLAYEDLIDVVIPRGGEGLIRAVVENSRIPVLKHYKGVCHIYVDEQADLEKAFDICINAKVQRPGVCNAMETLLVDSSVAESFLPEMASRFNDAGVELIGCPRTAEIVPDIKPATESDWYAEYLDLKLSVKIVDGMQQAIDHIEKYSSDHTEAIITENHTRAMEFITLVDSSTVIVNASTRFSDGGQFGLGAEVGISTSRVHAYGPMGVEGLTIEKFVCFGSGQTRK